MKITMIGIIYSTIMLGFTIIPTDMKNIAPNKSFITLSSRKLN